MYVGNRLTIFLSWAICIGTGSTRLAAFYIHSPHENMETLEKVPYNLKVPFVKWLKSEHVDEKIWQKVLQLSFLC